MSKIDHVPGISMLQAQRFSEYVRMMTGVYKQNWWPTGGQRLEDTQYPRLARITKHGRSLFTTLHLRKKSLRELCNNTSSWDILDLKR